MSDIPIDAMFTSDSTMGKSEGIRKWRIENKCPVVCSMDKKANGFHSGDAYIVLATRKLSSGKFEQNIHFWLGSECSVDESGIAAYKSVELDAALGGIATQYREMEGYESDEFLGLFKSGSPFFDASSIEYLPGGVDSGFTHVERDVWPQRLLHIKGKRTCRVKEVPVTASSLTQDDVYILDNGLTLYVWCGSNANKYEKAKALEVLTHINNDERGARAKIIRLSEDPTNNDFWTALGGFVDEANIALGDDDETVPPHQPNRLLKVSDASGTATTEEIALDNGKLKKSLLDGDDAFIIVAKGDVYIWVGKKCNVVEKKEATASAINFINSEKMDPSTKMERVSEGHESGKFKSLFASWDPPMSYKRMSNIAGTIEEKEVDINALLSRKAKMETMVDDGNGKTEIFIIKDFKAELVPETSKGEFFGGDSYIICYTYLVNGRERAMIYFWLGNDSTADERGSAALLTKEMDDSKFSGQATQVRVTQGKEPAHFRAIFKGMMIIHANGHASGFANSTEVTNIDTDGTALFHVKGTNANNSCGIQVKEEAASLNGEDCFVLVTPNNCYVWAGNAHSEDELNTASAIANQLANNFLGKSGRPVTQITEGNEPEDFWASIGGKGPYMEFAPGDEPPRSARLFEASTRTGVFTVEEITQFVQEDLCDDDVFLLDTFTQLFIWVGSGATIEESRKANDVAKKIYY